MLHFTKRRKNCREVKEGTARAGLGGGGGAKKCGLYFQLIGVEEKRKN